MCVIRVRPKLNKEIQGKHFKQRKFIRWTYSLTQPLSDFIYFTSLEVWPVCTKPEDLSQNNNGRGVALDGLGEGDKRRHLWARDMSADQVHDGIS